MTAISVPTAHYAQPLDIANKACFHWGVAKITTFADDSVQAQVAADIDARTRYSAAALNYGLGVAAAGYDVRAKLPSVTAPVLLVNGASDFLAPHEAVKPLLDGLPKVRLEVFAESAHFPFIEEQARFTKLVGEFLDALE